MIKVEDDRIRANYEFNTNYALYDKPKQGQMLNNMPTTEKVITQVQCQACGKSMSDSHAAYCIKRVQEIYEPKAIPVPKENIPELKQILSVKGVTQDKEWDDDEAEFV